MHVKIGNGSVRVGNSDGRRVGGAGGKGDVRLAAAGNAGQHRVPVCGVGTGKQGRQRERLVVGVVGVVNVVVRRRKIPRVSRGVVSGGSDAPGGVRSGGTAKNPKGLVGVVLTGIDINQQLRLALFEGNKRRKRRNDQSR